ncbi:TPA: hypothetical protein I7117_15330 [Vibrio vulnificus]|uniref:hypothetical protein n=1 Tax=Vibrio vulnificus TaxID=672 RepID=UPI001A214A73|nr:hypothetical protein [Vibrio navarrensis]HAS6100832.1 hypothetical protein [Vibrio vulnificus]HDY8121380.1 hypothetical protein [Vibrio vulnificus]
MSSEKQPTSLEALGYRNHYIGLTWRSLEAGASRKEADSQLKNICQKLDMNNGVLCRSPNAMAVGLSTKLRRDSLSAAAIVAAALSEDVENAFVVEHLGDDKYWYLCIRDRVPVTGRENDSIIEGKDRVIDQIFADYRTWEMVDRRVSFFGPEDIQNEVVSSLDDGNPYIGISYDDLVSATTHLKSAKISILRTTYGRTKGGDSSKGTVLIVLCLSAVAFYFVDQSSTEDIKNVRGSIDSFVAERKMTNSLISPSIDENELQLKKKIELQAVRDEEAKWMFQTLSLGDPVRVIDTLINYIDRLKVDIEGWYPKSITFNVRAKLDAQSNGSADMTFDKTVTTRWINSGASTVNRFKNATHKDNQVLYQLTGRELDVISRVNINLPIEIGDYEEAIDWLEQTNDMHLNLISELQTFERFAQDANFTWALATNTLEKRERVFTSTLDSKASYSVSQIQYTVVSATIKMSGFRKGYQTLKDLRHLFKKFPTLMITRLQIDLDTEEIEVVASLIKNNQGSQKQDNIEK